MTEQFADGFCFCIGVRETADKGLGVFTTERIEKGSTVWRHVPGNFTMFDEAAFRAFISALDDDETVYELTHVVGLKGVPDRIIKIHDAGALINHASPANLASRTLVTVDGGSEVCSSRAIPPDAEAMMSDRYDVIATRDIDAGEELTMDYLAECEEPDWFDDIYDGFDIDDSYLEDC